MLLHLLRRLLVLPVIALLVTLILFAIILQLPVEEGVQVYLYALGLEFRRGGFKLLERSS